MPEIDRTTTSAPLALSIDTVITCYPEKGERNGETGRWRVTAAPVRYDSWVRVDVHDENTRDDETWIVYVSETLKVELAGRALKAKAADLLADLVALNLPEMYRWEVSGEGLRGDLSRGLRAPDTVISDLEKWRTELGSQGAALSTDGVEREDSDRGNYSTFTVRAILRGVPVEIGTSFRTAELDADKPESEVAA